MNDLDELLFDDRETISEKSLQPEKGSWKLLIVDDEPEVHEITKLALNNFHFENRGLEFLSAYSANEAISIIESNPDIALTLLDVVMETDHAGLDLVQYIREDMNNNTIRIVLRTGQPGKAPERDVITNYDINDYAEKTDLTAQKLFTILVSGLRAYRDILELEDNRKELLIVNKDLDQERKRIQVTLDSIGDAVITTDDSGIVTHLNPIAETLTGWTLCEAKGKLLSEVFRIINADTRETVINPVEKVLAAGNIFTLSNHTILINKNGREFYVADSAAPIRDESGKMHGVILVCRDVTREYQTRDALHRAQKMEAIGQLSGGIAHDFNNQLGVIIGHLDFLGEYLQADYKPRKWVDAAVKATMRCTDLTRQLLAFSHRMPYQKSVLDINVSIKDMEAMATRSLTPEVEVQYLLAEDLWLTEIDLGEFQDAVLNLVINARDAINGAGKLVIETTNIHLDEDYAELNPDSNPGDYVQLMLSDTGSGMDKATQERAFEPFYTTKPKGKGTGLGLAMVYAFVKRFGGFIKIYSEPDIGTTIRICLPRSAASEPDTCVDQTREAELPEGDETILIVDDEIDLLQLADLYLGSLGYHTLLAENAAQALEILSENKKIDLLFSDVVMPGGMNGYELAQLAQQKQSDLKVLLTSGFASRTIMESGLARFSADLLNKPFRKAELAQRIRSILDNTLADTDNLTGRTFLIVDDDEDIQELFKLNLERLGCKSILAGTGDEAIELYLKAKQNNDCIDAVILDLRLSDSMNGKEVAEKLHEINPDIRIIVASGHTEALEMTHYEDYGFKGALEKDFDREKIKHVLDHVLSAE